MECKKILVVCHSAVTPFHLEKYVLLSQYYDVSILVPQLTREEGIDFRPVSRSINPHLHLIQTFFMFPRRIYIFFPVWIMIHLIRIKPDLLYLEEEDLSFCPVFCCFMQRLVRHRIPIVIGISENIRFSPFFRFPRYLGYRAFSWYTLRHVSGGLAINQAAEAILLDAGVKKVQRQAFYGIDQAWLDMERPHQYSGILHLGFIGRMIPEKGLSFLLHTLQKTDFPFVLDILGEGPEKSNLQCIQFRDDQIINWLGHVSHDTLPSVMYDWDFLVIPSLSTDRWKEQFGRVIIEALALEVPVLGSDCGSIPEVIGPGGQIFPEGREDELLAILQQWNQNPGLLNSYRQCAREHVKTHFTNRVLADKTRQFFESLGWPH